MTNENMQLLSFHNDPTVKKKYVARVLAHEKADEIVKGLYWSEGKGCAVGCTIHSSNHAAYQTELGLPEWLARLQDKLFEGMENKHAKKFPVRFLKAIPLGRNLEPVKWQFAAFLCRENIKRVNKLSISKELKTQVVNAIKLCLKVNTDAIKTGIWDESAESAAWSAAWSAARSAESAAWSAAWSAARSAESAARSAESAARSAESAAWSAAWSAAYKLYADKLIELLKDAK